MALSKLHMGLVYLKSVRVCVHLGKLLQDVRVSLSVRETDRLSTRDKSFEIAEIIWQIRNMRTLGSTLAKSQSLIVRKCCSRQQRRTGTYFVVVQGGGPTKNSSSRADLWPHLRRPLFQLLHLHSPSCTSTSTCRVTCFLPYLYHIPQL
jgi:hypothetical protein